MIPKLKAVERFGHYMKIMPVNTGLSTAQEIAFAKECAKSECETIIKILDGLHKPEYTCFDIYEPKQFTISEEVTDGYMLKQYFEEVISEIDKIV